MIYCSKCGKPNLDENQFCTFCGSEIHKVDLQSIIPSEFQTSDLDRPYRTKKNISAINVIAIVCSLIIIVGCFLPWIQFGSLISNKGIDNADGAIMLVASIIAGSIAAYNQTQNKIKNTWVFILTGIIGLITAFLDLSTVKERAAVAAHSFGEIENMFGSNGQINVSDFIGSGLYVVGLGSIGLIFCGSGIFNLRQSTSFYHSKGFWGSILVLFGCIISMNFFLTLLEELPLYVDFLLLLLPLSAIVYLIQYFFNRIPQIIIKISKYSPILISIFIIIHITSTDLLNTFFTYNLELAIAGLPFVLIGSLLILLTLPWRKNEE